MGETGRGGGGTWGKQVGEGGDVGDTGRGGGGTWGTQVGEGGGTVEKGHALQSVACDPLLGG